MRTHTTIKHCDLISCETILDSDKRLGGFDPTSVFSIALLVHQVAGRWINRTPLRSMSCDDRFNEIGPTGPLREYDESTSFVGVRKKPCSKVRIHSLLQGCEQKCSGLLGWGSIDLTKELLILFYHVGSKLVVAVGVEPTWSSL